MRREPWRSRSPASPRRWPSTCCTARATSPAARRCSGRSSLPHQGRNERPTRLRISRDAGVTVARETSLHPAENETGVADGRLRSWTASHVREPLRELARLRSLPPALLVRLGADLL